MASLARLVVLALLNGLLAGVLLDVLTFLVARYGWQGGSWSFRGNGALVVPLGIGPALLAGAWTGFVLRARGESRWLRGAAVVFAVGLVLILASSAVIVLFDSSAAAFAQVLIFVGWLWVLIAPLGSMIVARGTRARLQRLGAHVLAAAVFTLAAVGAFYASGLALAPGA